MTKGQNVVANQSMKVLAFSGSTRKESFNQKLVQIAGRGATDSGAEVTTIHLADYPLPLFDEDLEKEGMPENFQKLKELFLQADALLIASPEYNSSLTAVLKNVIDWMSRPVEGEPPMAAFSGKVVGIMATSPGGLGGLRGLVHLRAILSNIGCLVIPSQVAVPFAESAFDAGGMNQKHELYKNVLRVGEKVAQLVARIKD